MAETNYTINIESSPNYTIDIGTTGTRGKGATITVGETTTLHAGLPASVTNTGTSADAILDFSIPKGSVWFNGEGEPSSPLGDEGDYYLNVTDNTIYNKTTSTTWTYIGAISPSVSWGSLVGTLSNQTDLQDELDLKVDKVEGKGLSTNDLTDTLKTNYDTAYTNNHTHSNKTILDNTTASFTTAQETKLSNTSGVNTGDGVKLGTCSTASATAEKAISIDGFNLVAGTVFQITFTNANTATTPTMNINNGGSKSIKNLRGDVITYIPANIPLDFMYNGTDIIALYTNTFSCMPDYTKGISKTWETTYTVDRDGWIEAISNIFSGGTQNAYLVINGVYHRIIYSGTDGDANSTGGTLFYPMSKGDTYKGTSGTGGQSLIFYPMKGAS